MWHAVHTRVLPLLLSAAALAALAVACGASSPAESSAVTTTAVEGVEQFGYEIVHSHPHDPQAFTQGLTIADGQLYEGTGLHGRSSLRRVDLRSGAVLQQVALEPQYFGEGIAVVSDRIIQLTYTSGVGFVYERSTFKRTDTFTYTGEGWGLTYDGTRLIMSDGSDQLRFLDPDTFKEIGRVRVRDKDTAITQLNELEYVDGVLYANIWNTDRIARIDPATGRVTGWIDFSGLLTPTERARGVDVLNGVAYDPSSGHLLVTGKLWPRVFEVKLVKKS